MTFGNAHPGPIRGLTSQLSLKRFFTIDDIRECLDHRWHSPQLESDWLFIIEAFLSHRWHSGMSLSQMTWHDMRFTPTGVWLIIYHRSVSSQQMKFGKCGSIIALSPVDISSNPHMRISGHADMQTHGYADTQTRGCLRNDEEIFS